MDAAGRRRVRGHDRARERLAGEDDDEDHPWAVVTDAPAVVLELLVDQYDGWLDEEDDPGGHRPAGSRSAGPARGPRRIKRPGRSLGSVA